MIGPCSLLSMTLLLFSLYPIPLQADISLPSFGDRIYVSKGSNVTLAWTYNFGSARIALTQWLFSNAVKSNEVLADIIGGTVTIVNSSLPNINVIQPATLVLKNVSLDYNGTYTLQVTLAGASSQSSSDIRVIVVVQPVAIIACTTPVNVTEGENFSCICAGVNGHPPPTAYWLKDNNTIPITKGYLSSLLDKRNVSKNDNGTYTCQVRSGNFIDEQRVNVNVLHGPTFISFTSNMINDIVQVGDNVKLTCLADGNPKPNYKVTYMKNKTFEKLRTSSEGVLVINSVKISDDGLYCCVAKNNFGSKEAELVLNVTAKTTQSTTTASTTAPTSSANKTTASSSMTNPVPRTTTEKSTSDKNNGGTEWYIVVITLFCGIGIGIIFSFTVLWLYRRRKEKRDHPKPSQARRVSETHDNPSVYQELDLQRMNNEDSYQSTRKTSRPANRQEPTAEAESGYQELDKVRGSNDDNNYQSLNSEHVCTLRPM